MFMTWVWYPDVEEMLCVTATVPDVFVPTGVAVEWDFHSTVTMLENIFYSITAHNNNLSQYFNNNTV